LPAFIKEKWAEIQQEVYNRFPFVAETFECFLPIELKEKSVLLLGQFASPVAKTHLMRVLPHLEGIVNSGLKGNDVSRLRIEISEGELSAEQRFIENVSTHLDGGSRFKELQESNPALARLFNRVDGKLLE
jgi:hypothetical protein